jgi:hypothetical protein
MARRRKNGAPIVISAHAIKQEIAKIAFSNMQDYLKVGEDGQPVLDWKDLTRNEAAALSEVTVDTIGGIGDGSPLVTRTKFKLHKKLDALVALAHIEGLYESNILPPDHDKVRIDAQERGRQLMADMMLMIQAIASGQRLLR